MLKLLSAISHNKLVENENAGCLVTTTHIGKVHIVGLQGVTVYLTLANATTKWHCDV